MDGKKPLWLWQWPQTAGNATTSASPSPSNLVNAKATCPKGKGVAGFKWRRGEIEGKDDQAWKPGGLQVFCNTE